MTEGQKLAPPGGFRGGARGSLRSRNGWIIEPIRRSFSDLRHWQSDSVVIFLVEECGSRARAGISTSLPTRGPGPFHPTPSAAPSRPWGIHGAAGRLKPPEHRRATAHGHGGAEGGARGVLLTDLLTNWLAGCRTRLHATVCRYVEHPWYQYETALADSATNGFRRIAKPV